MYPQVYNAFKCSPGGVSQSMVRVHGQSSILKKAFGRARSKGRLKTEAYPRIQASAFERVPPCQFSLSIQNERVSSATIIDMTLVFFVLRLFCIRNFSL